MGIVFRIDLDYRNVLLSLPIARRAAEVAKSTLTFNSLPIPLDRGIKYR